MSMRSVRKREGIETWSIKGHVPSRGEWSRELFIDLAYFGDNGYLLNFSESISRDGRTEIMLTHAPFCTIWKNVIDGLEEWLLDRQDVMVHRITDLKLLGSEEDYQKVMIFFAEVIQAFGKSVEVRQQVIATATVYFKRFYSRNSLKAIDPWLMAPSCLFLASKVEDCSLIVFHPYRPLLQFCDELRPQLHELADLVLERAWWIVNDSLRTDVCLHYPPYIVALGCLQTAFVLLANNTDLLAGVSGSSGLSASGNRHSYFAQQPQPSVNPLSVADQWFSELNVDMEKVLEVTRHLMNLYDLWRRYDESTEMPNLLLKKIPRPLIVVQNPTGSQTSAQSFATSAAAATGGGAPSGAGSHSSASGGGGGAVTAGHHGNNASGGSGNMNESNQMGGPHHRTPNVTAGQVSRMHPQQQQQQQQSHHPGMSNYGAR